MTQCVAFFPTTLSDVSHHPPTDIFLMRLRVLPNSVWVAYTLTRPDLVRKLLPPSLELAAGPLLSDEVASMRTPKLLFNAYQVDSSWMRGTRLEVLVLARHRASKRHHFCVLDCLTDTLQWDPVGGVQGANARAAVRHAPGRTRVDVRTRVHVFAVDAVHCRPRPIAPTFAVEANEACYFRNTDVPYPMRFDVREVCAPVRELAPAKPVQNTLWADVRSRYPSHLFVHPHSMTYDVDVASFA